VTETPVSGRPPAPPPDVVRTAQDDRRGLHRLQRRILTFVVVILVVVGLPSIALSGHIGAEWALAFGDATAVTATVTGSSPSGEPSRTCSLTNIDVVWAAPVGDHIGQFTVCDDEVDKFTLGTTVRVFVLPGDSSVIQGEGRGSAIFGVVLETLVGLFFLLMLAGAIWQWLTLLTASRRWRDAPWLPGAAYRAPATGRRRGRAGGQQILVVPVYGSVPWTRPASRSARRRTCLAPDVPYDIGQRADQRGLEPQDAISLSVQRRRDNAQLADGDQVWVAPAGRTLRGHRRAGPYAVIRAADRQVFWATGLPMPGQGW
jgi:hypothetical protein